MPRQYADPVPVRQAHDRAVLSALADESRRSEIEEATGLDKRQMQRTLNRLRRAGAVRVRLHSKGHRLYSRP